MSFGSEQTQQIETVAVTEPTVKEANEVQILENGGIVVNGKIYTAEAAGKKIANADPHIATIEAENADKDDMIARLLSKFEALEGKIDHQAAVSEVVGQLKPEPVAQTEPSPTQEISMDELVEAAVSSIKKQEVSATQETNLQASISAAQDLYGESFGTEVDKIGDDMGMSSDEVIAMAKNQPSVFKTVFLKGEKKIDPAIDTTSTSAGVDAGQMTIIPDPKYVPFRQLTARQRASFIKNKVDALNV